MSVLDTHIWVWWVHGDARLNEKQVKWVEENEAAGLGISAISCWEVAKLVEYGRLTLPCSVGIGSIKLSHTLESGCLTSRRASHLNPHNCRPYFTVIRQTKLSLRPPEFIIVHY